MTGDEAWVQYVGAVTHHSGEGLALLLSNVQGDESYKLAYPMWIVGGDQPRVRSLLGEALRRVHGT